MHTTPLLAPKFQIDSDGNGGVGFTVLCEGHPLNGVRLVFERKTLAHVLGELKALRIARDVRYYPHRDSAQVAFETKDVFEGRSSSYFTIRYLTLPGQPKIECDLDGMLAFEKLLKRASGALLI